MEILRNSSDNTLVINQETNLSNDLGWEESLQQFETEILDTIINPIENYETVRYIHSPYTSINGVNQTDIWFEFYFYTGTTFNLDYNSVGLTPHDNSLMLKDTTNSFFRLEFYKTPGKVINNVLTCDPPTRQNRKLVFAKNLSLPNGEKFFYDLLNHYIHIPVFTGSNYRNKENMYLFWFTDESVLTETNISGSTTGNTFFMTAKFYNALDGSIIDFTNRQLCIDEAQKVNEPNDMYYQVDIDKRDYSYQVYKYSGSTRSSIVGRTGNSIKFYEKGPNIGINCIPPPCIPSISYSPTGQTFTVGTAITTWSPSVTCSPTGYTITPTLPSGLTFNISTGVITGTPLVAATSTGYTVTAFTASGYTGHTTITIQVNDVPPPPQYFKATVGYDPSSYTNACNFVNVLSITGDTSTFCDSVNFTSNGFSGLTGGTYYISYMNNYIQVNHTNGTNSAVKISGCTACSNTVPDYYVVRNCHDTNETYIVNTPNTFLTTGSTYTPTYTLTSSDHSEIFDGVKCWQVTNIVHENAQYNVAFDNLYSGCSFCVVASFVCYSGTSLNAACTGTTEVTMYYRGNLSSLGTILYTDPSCNIPAENNTYYNDFNDGKIFKVQLTQDYNEDGNISSHPTCPIIVTTGSTLCAVDLTTDNTGYQVCCEPNYPSKTITFSGSNIYDASLIINIPQSLLSDFVANQVFYVKGGANGHSYWRKFQLNGSVSPSVTATPLIDAQICSSCV
jgi:hypothetical protein